MGTQTQKDMEQVIFRHIGEENPINLVIAGVGRKTEAWTIKEQYPGIQVIGFEPNLATIQYLQDKGFPGVLVPVAVGFKARMSVLHVPTDESKVDSSTLDARRLAGSYLSVVVPVLPMEDMLYGMVGRSILWMDVEGYELETLMGATSWLNKSRFRWINMEFNLDNRASEAAHYFLMNKGYKCVERYNIHSTHEDRIYVI